MLWLLFVFVSDWRRSYAFERGYGMSLNVICVLFIVCSLNVYYVSLYLLNVDVL